MAYVPTYTSAEGLVSNLPTAYVGSPGSNNYKLATAAYLGIWKDIADTIADFRTLSHPSTSRGSALDTWGVTTLNKQREPGHSDAEYLLSLKGEVRRRIGGGTVADVIEFVDLVIGGGIGPGDVTITQNTDPDTGDYQPAFYTVSINTSLLISKGFSAAQIPDALSQIESILNETAAAGVEAKVILEGGGVWDTDVWDGAGAIYGS